MKKQNKEEFGDMRMFRTHFQEILKNQSKIGVDEKKEYFEDILSFFIVSLAIIFQPINLIIGGIITIIILLII